MASQYRKGRGHDDQGVRAAEFHVRWPKHTTLPCAKQPPKGSNNRRKMRHWSPSSAGDEAERFRAFAMSPKVCMVLRTLPVSQCFAKNRLRGQLSAYLPQAKRAGNPVHGKRGQGEAIRGAVVGYHALPVGLAEVLPGALVLSEQRAGPEGGDVGPVAGELLHRLLEAGDGPSRDTEDVEEGVPKRFGSAKTPCIIGAITVIDSKLIATAKANLPSRGSPRKQIPAISNFTCIMGHYVRERRVIPIKDAVRGPGYNP